VINFWWSSVILLNYLFAIFQYISQQKNIIKFTFYMRDLSIALLSFFFFLICPDSASETKLWPHCSNTAKLTCLWRATHLCGTMGIVVPEVAFETFKLTWRWMNAQLTANVTRPAGRSDPNTRHSQRNCFICLFKYGQFASPVWPACSVCWLLLIWFAL